MKNYSLLFLVVLIVGFKSVYASKIVDINGYHQQIKAVVQQLCNEKKYQKSLEYCIHQIEIAQKDTDLAKESIATKLLGTSYYHMGRRKDAIREWNKAISLSEKANIPMVAQNCYSNIGATALEIGNHTLAEKQFLISLSIAKKMGQEGQADYLNTLRLLASLYGVTKQFHKADSLFQGIINNPITRQNVSTYYTAKVFYSKILVESGQWLKGISLSDSCLMEVRKYNDFDLKTTVMSVHIGNLLNRKRYQEAYYLNKELEQLTNERNIRIIDKNISDAEVRFKTSQIKYEKELSLFEAKKDKDRLIYLGLGSILILILLFVFISQRRKILANEHIQSEKIITLIEGEEKERMRIAKDLHDGIVQNLTALKMSIQTIKPESIQLKNELINIGTEIDLLSKEIRSISYQMMPVTLKELGLSKAIEDVFSRNLSKYAIISNFDSIGLENRLPELVEVNVFRIAQELLNNILKHSNATQVDIVLINRNNRFQFIVEDNGIGFPKGLLVEGIGMNSIRTRLSAINGKIEFDSKENGGTIVTVIVPY